MLIVFSLTMFVSATLLFLIQPMFTKMVLPLLGGTPAVWNTCMVFYQAALLAGYVYAHTTPKWLGVRRQAAVHLGLLLLIILALPIEISRGWTPPQTSNPILWLLLLLLISVGLPFFVISTTAPMLQKWFAHTGHHAAQDPYFLYGASNLGSMLALVGYPLVVEPYLRLKSQAWVWAGGYLFFLGLIALCAVILWRSAAAGGSGEAVAVSPPGPLEQPAVPPLTLSRRAWWVLLAFAPSSLLLGVTSFLSTDIASVPLLWVIPLAIYLLTFVLVFARRPLVPHRIMVFIEPFLVIPVVILFFDRAQASSWQIFPLHLLAFFCIAMVCHGELMQARPPAAQLTEFYLWMSVGGVLGGIFNALVAPMVFQTVIEYPLIIVLACMLRPDWSPQGPQWYRQPRCRHWLDYLLPLALAALLAGLSRIFIGIPDQQRLVMILVVGCLAGILCYSFRERPRRFALGLGVVILAGMWFSTGQSQTLLTERNFFGVLKVKQVEQDGRLFHILSHGSTMHGAQCLDPSRRRDPLLYFHRSGPLGQIFATFAGGKSWQEVGIIGLGAGSIASYAQPGQHYTYYEIDPAVEQVARNPRYFTYLADCQGKVDVVLGDARLSLTDAPPAHYDMVILDAFSSDAIPIHLITQEALSLYLAKLKAGGLLACNISNRYLDLKPVIGNLAREAGLTCLVQQESKLPDWEIEEGKCPSEWVLMARRPEDLGNLAADPRWHRLSGQPQGPLWTDDFSNIVAVFKWGTFNFQQAARNLSGSQVTGK